MKASIEFTKALSALSSAHPSNEGAASGEWAPGRGHDMRGPCPMLNTLANHGYLPHNGGNITLDNAMYAMETALNLDAPLIMNLWEAGAAANPEPNATFFHSINYLNVHIKGGEHDASIRKAIFPLRPPLSFPCLKLKQSRRDAYFGNSHIFDEHTFATTTAFWTDGLINVTMLAKGRMARQLASKAFNPTYTFTEATDARSKAEMASLLLVFGDGASKTFRRDVVKFFFEHEQLPFAFGWRKPANSLDLEQLLALSKMIGDAASLISNPASSTAV